MKKIIDESHTNQNATEDRFQALSKSLYKNIWFDTLYDRINLSKDSFYNELENSLKEFCNNYER